MANLRPVAKRGVDVKHGHLANNGILPQTHRSCLDGIGVGAVAVEVSIFANNRIVTDAQKIRAYRNMPGVNDDISTDIGA